MRTPGARRVLDANGSHVQEPLTGLLPGPDGDGPEQDDEAFQQVRERVHALVTAARALSDTCADLADALRPVPGHAPDDPMVAAVGRLRAERTAALLDEAASAARGTLGLLHSAYGALDRPTAPSPRSGASTWPDAFVEVAPRAFTVEDEAGTAVGLRSPWAPVGAGVTKDTDAGEGGLRTEVTDLPVDDEDEDGATDGLRAFASPGVPPVATDEPEGARATGAGEHRTPDEPEPAEFGPEDVDGEGLRSWAVPAQRRPRVPDREPATGPAETTTDSDDGPTAGPDPAPTAGPDLAPTAGPDSGPTSEPDSERTAAADREPTADSEPATGPGSTPTSDGEPAADPGSDLTADSDPTPNADSDPTTGADSDPTDEADSGSATDSDPTTDTDSASATGPDSTPTADADDEPADGRETDLTADPDSEPAADSDPTTDADSDAPGDAGSASTADGDPLADTDTRLAFGAAAERDAGSAPVGDLPERPDGTSVEDTDADDPARIASAALAGWIVVDPDDADDPGRPIRPDAVVPLETGAPVHAAATATDRIDVPIGAPDEDDDRAAAVRDLDPPSGPAARHDDAGWHGDTVSAEPRSLSLVPPVPEGPETIPPTWRDDRPTSDPWASENPWGGDPLAGADLSGAATFARVERPVWTAEPVPGSSVAGDGVAVFPIGAPTPAPDPAPAAPMDEPAAAVIARQVEAARRHLQAALVVANGPTAPQRLGALLTAVEQVLTAVTDLARETRGLLESGLGDRTFPGEARFLCSPPWDGTVLVGRDAYGDDVASPAGLAKLLRALGYEAHSITSSGGVAGVQVRADRYAMQVALVEPAGGGRQRWSGALEWTDSTGSSRTWAETLGPAELEDEELARRVDELLRRSIGG